VKYIHVENRNPGSKLALKLPSLKFLLSPFLARQCSSSTPWSLHGVVNRHIAPLGFFFDDIETGAVLARNEQIARVASIARDE
jgi:hypothetical protein